MRQFVTAAVILVVVAVTGGLVITGIAHVRETANQTGHWTSASLTSDWRGSSPATIGTWAR